MHCIHLFAALLSLSLGAVSPLSREQTGKLASAVDSSDERDEAFAALVENTNHWTAGPGDSLIRLQPDFGALIENPAAYRGDLCRLAGKLQQHTQLATPYNEVWEWFVRTDAGRPIMVYVTGLGENPMYSDGGDIEIDARFYKRIDAPARDRKTHSYPAFVGAFPRMISERSATSNALNSSDGLWIVGGLIAAMAVVFIALLLYARSRRAVVIHSRFVRAAEAPPLQTELDGGPPLPDDPAAALAELKRRAQSS